MIWLSKIKYKIIHAWIVRIVHFHFHFSPSCIGEGNGNLLQCSCLENPRDEGAWWAAVCGVAQSRTRLKQLSSSSSIKFAWHKLFIFVNMSNKHSKYLEYCSVIKQQGISFLLYLIFPGSSAGTESACKAGDPVWLLGREDPLEEG